MFLLAVICNLVFLATAMTCIWKLLMTRHSYRRAVSRRFKALKDCEPHPQEPEPMPRIRTWPPDCQGPKLVSPTERRGVYRIDQG